MALYAQVDDRLVERRGDATIHKA